MADCILPLRCAHRCSRASNSSSDRLSAMRSWQRPSSRFNRLINCAWMAIGK